MTKGESNAFLLLLFVSVIIILWPLYPVIHKESDFSPLISLVDSLDKSIPYVSSASGKPELRTFDPNTSSLDELVSLGFKPFMAKRLIRFREKYGPYKSKVSLLKLYGMDSGFYSRIKDYVLLPDSYQNQKTSNLTKQTKAMAKQDYITLELNSADTIALDKLPCIGMKLAKRILAYRERLGGFYAVQQLREVYGIDTGCLNTLFQRVSVDSKAIRKININQVDEPELSKHPYVGYSQAKIIIAYRKQHGSFDTLEKLRNLKGLDRQKLDKLLPYLNLE